MEMYQVLMTVFSGLTLLGSGAAIAVGIIIKFNDLVHIDKKVDELTKTINNLVKIVEKNDKDISVINAVCKERHQG